MLDAAQVKSEPVPVKRASSPVTPRKLARVRQLPLEKRLKAAAAMVAQGQSIKPSKRMVADVHGVSVGRLNKALNGAHRHRPKVAPKTLADLTDLWQEVFVLAGVKYQGGDYQRERFIAFEHFLAKWWIDHPDVRELTAMDSAAALHATAVRGMAALIEAIVGNYGE